jgi:hypothetical protein
MFGICPGGGQIGMGGVPLGTFSLNGEEGEQPQRQQKPQNPAQPAPTTPTAEPQVPSGVTVNVNEPRPFRNLELAPDFYFTGMGVILEYTVTDENGDVIRNVTVTEEVRPSDTIQNPKPVTFPNGTVSDLVGQGQFGPQTYNQQEASTEVRKVLENPYPIIQDHALFVMSPTSGRSAIFTHQRTFSNLDANGKVRPAEVNGRTINNFRVTLSPITVHRVPLVICPRF